MADMQPPMQNQQEEQIKGPDTGPLPQPPAPRPQPGGPEPVGGGIKALMVVLAIFFAPIGSIIAWVYGARNSGRPGSGIVRVVGMIFTVLALMVVLVLGAALMLIPGMMEGLMQQGADELDVYVPPPAAQQQAGAPDVNMQRTGQGGSDEAPPEIKAVIDELIATVGDAVKQYYMEHGEYPTLAQLNDAGLLDGRFTPDPAHPVEHYEVTINRGGESGQVASVNVAYTGPRSDSPSAGAADSADGPVTEDTPDTGFVADAVAGGGEVASAAVQEAPADSVGQQQPGLTQRRGGGGSGLRGAERWLQWVN